MKVISIIKTLVGAALPLMIWSCTKLDINENPNSATASTITPDLVLTQAIATTASNVVTYHSYGAFLVGYQLPGSGISGYGDTYTYNFTSSTNTSLWNNVFSNLRDFQFIIDYTDSDPQFKFYGDIARILKVFNYQLLVDAYGDVPYKEALQGDNNLTPAFDDDAAVYEALVTEIDVAISDIRSYIDDVSYKTLSEDTDPVFAGDLENWIKFANNIKLRLLVRARGTSIDSFVQTAFGTFSDDGFLLDDVLVDPGYQATASQNPLFGAFHSSTAGSITTAANYYIPSKYLFSFYNGTKISDIKRGSLTFKNYPNTSVGQLADETNNPNSDDYVWYIGTGSADALGVLKGRTAGFPIFLAAETHFLLAEAALYGHELDGTAKQNFNKGILASFTYLEKNASNALASGQDPESDLQDYQDENAENYLVNFDKGENVAQHLEAIITQKYIALNFFHGHEAWNEFRRTAYPSIVNGSTLATETFVSIQSGSSRADKLPVRNLYPQTEVNLNSNVPKLTNAFSDPIFWDLN
ncbi:SusD/RagB family nutrient-binding outer membrane lipoprotein [Sphingobacterium sp. LRF_L2]|uniref:SusD/RagB family nutrient-binding outer membrane lipoprotein n=1 Tax=Sphingobacterium sp. LRF_L2 TaxID=3369421 RepID=UPI003F62828B